MTRPRRGAGRHLDDAEASENDREMLRSKGRKEDDSRGHCNCKWPCRLTTRWRPRDATLHSTQGPAGPGRAPSRVISLRAHRRHAACPPGSFVNAAVSRHIVAAAVTAHGCSNGKRFLFLCVVYLYFVLISLFFFH